MCIRLVVVGARLVCKCMVVEEGEFTHGISSFRIKNVRNGNRSY